MESQYTEAIYIYISKNLSIHSENFQCFYTTVTVKFGLCNHVIQFTCQRNFTSIYLTSLFLVCFCNLHGQPLAHRKCTFLELQVKSYQVKLRKSAQIKVLQGQLPKILCSYNKMSHQVFLTFAVVFLPSATHSFLNVQTPPYQEKEQHRLLWLLFHNGKYSTELAKNNQQTAIGYEILW